jgi:hypothetical protein
MTKHEIIINNYAKYVEHIKPYIFACTDAKLKQYMLYFLFVRAKMVKIDESYAIEALLEVVEYDSTNDTCPLEAYQYETASTGYTDKRKIWNKTFTKKTGIIFYTKESNTAREFECELTRHGKVYQHSKRVDLLKRLVKRKNDVTVDEVLEYFRKHDVGIGRTKFYNTNLFKVIMSVDYKEGMVKVLKNKNGGYSCRCQ